MSVPTPEGACVSAFGSCLVRDRTGNLGIVPLAVTPKSSAGAAGSGQLLVIWGHTLLPQLGHRSQLSLGDRTSACLSCIEMFLGLNNRFTFI